MSCVNTSTTTLFAHHQSPPKARGYKIIEYFTFLLIILSSTQTNVSITFLKTEMMDPVYIVFH